MLQQLTQLPRPIYGHIESVTNLALGYVHSHPWLQFSYAIQGVLDVYTATGRFLAPPQRAVWIPANVEHQVRCSVKTQIRSLYIQPTELAVAVTGCQVVEVSPLLRELIHSFSGLPENYDEQGAQGRLAAVLLDQLACAPHSNSTLPLPRDARLLKIAECLQEGPDDATSLAQWAQQLRVSEKTLSRLFKQQTGLTFRRWRQRLRLLSSLSYLEQGQAVTDVAFICGYESVSAFIHAFQEYFTKTPGELFTAGKRGNS